MGVTERESKHFPKSVYKGIKPEPFLGKEMPPFFSYAHAWEIGA